MTDWSRLTGKERAQYERAFTTEGRAEAQRERDYVHALALYRRADQEVGDRSAQGHGGAQWIKLAAALLALFPDLAREKM